MKEDKLDEMIGSSLNGIKQIADLDSVIGSAIQTPSGVTVIPISKISAGFASGGFDVGGKSFAKSNGYGAGGGTGLSITPIGFITVDPMCNVKLISVTEQSNDLENLAKIIDKAPDLIDKIKDVLT